MLLNPRDEGRVVLQELLHVSRVFLHRLSNRGFFIPNFLGVNQPLHQPETIMKTFFRNKEALHDGRFAPNGRPHWTGKEEMPLTKKRHFLGFLIGVTHAAYVHRTAQQISVLEAAKNL